MPQLQNFIRGGGSVAAASGAGLGGFVTAQPFEDIATLDGTELVAALAREKRISSARLLATDHAQTAIKTREKDLRTRDSSFDGLLLIEGLDEAAVKAAARNLAAKAPKRNAPASIYIYPWRATMHRFAKRLFVLAMVIHIVPSAAFADRLVDGVPIPTMPRLCRLRPRCRKASSGFWVPGSAVGAACSSTS
jgi:hypothetical protein